MDQSWFIWREDECWGPLSDADLVAMKSRGEISPDTIISRGENGPKRPARMIKGLFTPEEIAASQSVASPRGAGSFSPPASPGDVAGVEAWGKTQLKQDLDFQGWWLWAGALVSCMLSLFLLQILLLPEQGMLWFCLSLGVVLGVRLLYRLMKNKWLARQYRAYVDHQLQNAGLISDAINQSQGYTGGYLNYLLPTEEVVTCHPKYVFLASIEQNRLQAVPVSDLRSVEKRKTHVASTSSTYATHSTSSHYSGSVDNGYVSGSGGSVGTSESHSVGENIFEHKLVINTRNSRHPTLTLNFLEDETSMDFVYSCVENIIEGHASFDDVEVPQLTQITNRSLADIREWHEREARRARSAVWFDMLFNMLPMQVQAAVGLAMLFAMLALVQVFIALTVVVVTLPAGLINEGFIQLGLTAEMALLAGMVVVFGGIGALSLIPACRERLRSWMSRPTLRMVISGLFVWLVVGELALGMVAVSTRVRVNQVAQKNPRKQPALNQPEVAQAEENPPAEQGVDLLKNAVANNGLAVQPVNEPLAERPGMKPAKADKQPPQNLDVNALKAKFLQLLQPGRGWQAVVKEDNISANARFVVVDANADASQVRLVIESEDNLGKRGAFEGRLDVRQTADGPLAELVVKAAAKAPYYPMSFYADGLVLKLQDQTLAGNGEMIQVDLSKPVESVLWSQQDLHQKLHADFAPGKQWKGYEVVGDQASRDVVLTVTDDRNEGRNVRIVGELAENPRYISVFEGGFNDSDANLWGWPILFKATGSHPGQRDSALVSPYEKELRIGYRTDGKLVSFCTNGTVTLQEMQDIPDFTDARTRWQAALTPGSFYAGSIQSADNPPAKVVLTVAEMADSGANLRVLIIPVDKPHCVHTFIGQVALTGAGSDSFALRLNKKQGAPGDRSGILGSGSNGNIGFRLAFDGKWQGVASTDEWLELERSEPPAEITDLSTTAFSQLLEETLATQPRWEGTLVQLESGVSANVAVEFERPDPSSPLIRALITLPGGPRGRMIYEGRILNTPEAVNGYAIQLTKRPGGIKDAKSVVFNTQSNTPLWFRLELDGKSLWGIAGDNEVFQLAPAVTKKKDSK